MASDRSASAASGRRRGDPATQRGRRQESQLITDAAGAASAEAAHRSKSYLILMAVRVVCIMVAFLIPGWAKWPVIAAAAILPSVAVMIANQPNQKKLLAARRNVGEDDEPSDRPAIGDGRHLIVHGEVDDPEVVETTPRPRGTPG